MTTRYQDFRIVAGDTPTFSVTATDEAGDPLSLAGLTIYWQLKRGIHATSALISKTNGAGITVTNEAGGLFDIGPLEAADTEDLEGVYYHEASVVDASDNVSTILVGKAIIERSVILEA